MFYPRTNQNYKAYLWSGAQKLFQEKPDVVPMNADSTGYVVLALYFPMVDWSKGGVARYIGDAVHPGTRF